LNDKFVISASSLLHLWVAPPVSVIVIQLILPANNQICTVQYTVFKVNFRVGEVKVHNARIWYTSSTFCEDRRKCAN